MPAISAEQKQRLGELGRDLKRLWEAPQAPVELKKRLLRTVIEEIVVTTQEPPAEHRLQIHWAGGVHTELRVPRNPRGMHGRMADRSLVELVRELAQVCDDQTIAAVLNRLGLTTGQGNGWRMARVNSFRHTHGIELGDGHPGCVTLQGAARRLQVSDTRSGTTDSSTGIAGSAGSSIRSLGDRRKGLGIASRAGGGSGGAAGKANPVSSRQPSRVTDKIRQIEQMVIMSKHSGWLLGWP